MTTADKLAAIWARIEQEDEDGEWLWKVLYQLERVIAMKGGNT